MDVEQKDRASRRSQVRNWILSTINLLCALHQLSNSRRKRRVQKEEEAKAKENHWIEDCASE
jgi:hypothetical protein